MTESATPKVVTGAAIVLLVAALGFHVFGVVSGAGREPHVDETESLHAAWLMRNGERLYETFFEHHSPFLFATLATLAPEGEGAPAKPYFERARLLAGFAGLVALVAFAIALAPAAREAPAFGVALLVATGVLWLRGFAEARAEPFAMAFFAAGLAFVVRCRGVAAGVGIALVAASALWNPKAPLMCVAVGIVFLYRNRFDRVAWLAAAAGGVVLLGTLRLLVPLDLWWFFNFDVNLALSRSVQNSRQALDLYFGGGEPFLFVPEAFHPWIVLPAVAIVAAGLAVKPSLSRSWPLLLLAASVLELRFFLPWPAIWSHYYLMWSLASAATLAMAPVSIDIVMRRLGVPLPTVAMIRTSLVVAGAVLAGAHILALSGGRPESSTYWVSERYLNGRLVPGDTVWLEPHRHPVTVRDAHYYWFLVGQMVPAARELRQTERGRRYLPSTEDLPTCAPPASLRFTLDPRSSGVMPAAACMDALETEGRVRKTVFADVWEVR